ncbi:MAG: NAD(P)-binding protein [Candidatus Parcubacteria bacterium]|nr:NAD(P)-binding protein [Candidatus Parcubacteria bacterium]
MDSNKNTPYPQKNILILGAGPAGLACAYGLMPKAYKITILEKENEVGGFAKTLEFKEDDLTFKTDIGPHRFFSQNKKLYQIAQDLLGTDWIDVNRQTRQYIDGKYYDYPIKPLQALKNIGLIKAVVIIFSYLRSFIIYKSLGRPINNFQDYIAANFGLALGRFNMLNYTEKIWGIPCSRLHADWAKQRIKGLNFITAISDSLFKRKKTKTLIDIFKYPRLGNGQLYKKMAAQIIDRGNEINFASQPLEIFHSQNRITKIITDVNGLMQEFNPEYLVSSIPIDQFLSILNPLPPPEILAAAAKLKWRDQIYLFITLNKNQVTDDNWIYFPNQNIPFARISEMKNFSQAMSPEGKTSLFIEFFTNQAETLWQSSDQDLFNLALNHLEKIGLITAKDVRNYYVFKKQKVYPVYDLNYPANLKIIKSYLNQLENFYYIGRPGRFQYNNQDHSLEMGLLAAQGIETDKKLNPDQIGNSDEYFENGKLNNNS